MSYGVGWSAAFRPLSKPPRKYSERIYINIILNKAGGYEKEVKKQKWYCVRNTFLILKEQGLQLSHQDMSFNIYVLLNVCVITLLCNNQDFGEESLC